MHGGRFHDPTATRIEAYRRGMQAILRGAGDSFILGCNHPIWPSLGLIHGSRSSNDIKRTWDRIETTARQNLQSQLAERPAVVERSRRDRADGRSDRRRVSVSCDGDLRQRRHGAVGRRSDALPPARAAMLQEAAAADRRRRRRSRTRRCGVGTVALPAARMLCLFNWDDAPRTLSRATARRGDGHRLLDRRIAGRRDGVLSIEHAAAIARAC